MAAKTQVSSHRCWSGYGRCWSRRCRSFLGCTHGYRCGLNRLMAHQARLIGTPSMGVGQGQWGRGGVAHSARLSPQNRMRHSDRQRLLRGCCRRYRRRDRLCGGSSLWRCGRLWCRLGYRRGLRFRYGAGCCSGLGRGRHGSCGLRWSGLVTYQTGLIGTPGMVVG